MVDIPVEYQKTVQIMYYLWMCESLGTFQDCDVKQSRFKTCFEVHRRLILKSELNTPDQQVLLRPHL